MPRERVHHGKLYVDEPNVEPGLVTDSGRPAGVAAHAMRVYQPGEILAEGEKIREKPSLDDNWRRDPGWVQLSIEAPADWWDQFAEGRDNVEQSHYAVFTDILTREELNNLIRTLRRARNAAFGEDE